MTQPDLFAEAVRPCPPVDERANLVAYVERVLPSLEGMNMKVMHGMRVYFERYGHVDVTGMELANDCGLPVTSVRPRLHGLCKAGLIHKTQSLRESRAQGEAKCHAYFFPSVTQ